jgi:hypothetical protein
VKREIVVARATAVGLFGAVGVALALVTALAGLGRVGWAVAGGSCALAAGYWPPAGPRLRRVDRLLAGLEAAPSSDR